MTPKIIDKDEKRSAIVEAAAEVFAQKGYRAATMEEVSHQAAIAKGTTYLYFKSKKELFLAVFDWYVETMLGQAMEAMKPVEGRTLEMLELFMRETLEALEQIRNIFPLSMEFWAASVTGEYRGLFGRHMSQLYDRYRKVVAAMIEQGVAEGAFRPETDSEALASVLVGAIDGLKIQTWLDPELDIFKLGRAFMETFIRGLAPEKEGQES